MIISLHKLSQKGHKRCPHRSLEGPKDGKDLHDLFIVAQMLRRFIFHVISLFAVILVLNAIFNFFVTSVELTWGQRTVAWKEENHSSTEAVQTVNVITR